METNATYHSASPEDALWTLYRQQTLRVRHAFLARVRMEDREVGAAAEMPGMYNREEMMELSNSACMTFSTSENRHYRTRM